MLRIKPNVLSVYLLKWQKQAAERGKSVKEELEVRGYRVNAVARAFGVSPDTIKRGISLGHIKAIPFGGCVLITRAEVDRLEREGISARGKVKIGTKSKTKN